MLEDGLRDALADELGLSDADGEALLLILDEGERLAEGL
jgi:hypothetical protein